MGDGGELGRTMEKMKVLIGKLAQSLVDEGVMEHVYVERRCL